MAYNLTEQARQDVILIYRYGASTYGAAQAEQYGDALEAAFDLLAQFPHLAPPRTQYDPPLHLYPLDSHLILYRHQREDIVILRIFHSRQHWQRFL